MKMYPVKGGVREPGTGRLVPIYTGEAPVTLPAPTLPPATNEDDP